MHTSILQSILNISNNSNTLVSKVQTSSISINQMGDGLESFVKDAFANTFTTDKSKKIEIYNKLFSWEGNQNNPPDLIIKNKEAIEVKKIEGYGAIALNSSFPKNKISNTDPMITKDCGTCECTPWTKPLYYYIGTISKTNFLNSLFILEANCYAADESVYLKMKNIIKEGTENIENVVFSETKELGKVKQVDPLGITDLRIRGMWSIKNPYDVFNYVEVITKPLKEESVIYAIISKTTYMMFDRAERKKIEEMDVIDVNDIKIKSPNNPVKLINAKLIKVKLV
jgi:hypothetical protein